MKIEGFGVYARTFFDMNCQHEQDFFLLSSLKALFRTKKQVQFLQ